MAFASSRVANGPIWTWSRVSLGSLRTITLYPRFFNAATKTSASSWRETAAICTIVGTAAGGAAGAAVCVPETAIDVEATAGDAFAVAGVPVDGVAAAEAGLDGGDEVATSESCETG